MSELVFMFLAWTAMAWLAGYYLGHAVGLKQSHERKPRSVACPDCKAEPGHCCYGAMGGPNYYHPARIRACQQ